MKKIISALCLLFVFATNAFGQDLIFANRNQSLLNTNPSFAGSNSGMRVQSVFQIRNPQKEYSWYSMQTAADMYLKKWRAAVALNYAHDNNTHGLETSQNINLTYAQHFTLNKLKIIPSLQVGFFEKQFDIGRVTYGQIPQLIPQYPNGFPVSKRQNFDFNSGLLFQYKTFYGGVSVFHINQPDEGLWNTSKLPARFNFHASYNFLISEKTLVQVSGIFSTQQKNQFLQLEANAVFFKHLVCGLNFVRRENLGGVLGYRHDYFSATLNYFVSVSKLSGNTGGSWELALSYNLRNKDNRKKLTAFEAW